jgi:hypothetical protein
MDIASSSSVSIESAELLIPESVELLSAYPNPFNPSTQVRLQLSESDEIRLELFNLSGAKLTEIHQGMLSSGLHRFQIDMTGYASGVYFVRLATSTDLKVLPITLLR